MQNMQKILSYSHAEKPPVDINIQLIKCRICKRRRQIVRIVRQSIKSCIREAPTLSTDADRSTDSNKIRLQRKKTRPGDLVMPDPIG